MILRRTRCLLALAALTAACGPTAWVWEDGGRISAPPLRIGDRVLVATDEFGARFSVTALDWSSGDALWVQREAGWEPCDQLVGDEGGAFVACGSMITALDPGSGLIRWRAQLPGPPVGPVALDEGGLLVRIAPPEGADELPSYVGPDHGRAIHGDGTLDPGTTGGQGADDQALVWRWMAGYPPAYAWLWMAMDDVVGSADLPRGAMPAPPMEDRGRLSPDPEAALTWDPLLGGAPADPFRGGGPSSGEDPFVLPWAGAELPPMPHDPDPAGGHLAVILDRQTGEAELHVRGSGKGPLVMAGGQVVWVSPEGVAAVDTARGTLSWQHPTGLPSGAEGQASLVAGVGLVILTTPGRMEALGVFNGEALWAVGTEGRVAPVLTHDAALFIEGGKLKALSLADGSLRWWAPAPGVIDAPLAAGDAAYLETVDGDVMAFDLRTGEARWRADADARGEAILVGDRYLWVGGQALRGLSLSGEAVGDIPLPGPGLSPHWQPMARVDALAPVVRDQEVLLRVDEDRLVMLKL